jgi:NADPH2:quinone reductase
MPQVIRLHQTGGPEVLQWETIDLPELQPHEVRVRHTAIGLNFIDTYQRSGLYPLTLPATLGKEAAGVVEEVGSSVKHLRVGDRIAYVHGTSAYSDVCHLNAEHAVSLPNQVPDEVAAASMLKGMTAEYLLRRIGKVQPGEVILWHAVAGGTGLIACQWARALGCTVIGTVGSPEKEALAREYGCDHIINYQRENFLDRVMEVTDGKGVRLAFDSVGNDTFDGTLGCMQKRGLLVSFGQASGIVPPQDLRVFAAKSLFYTRPSLFDYVATRKELLDSANALFDVLLAGQVQVDVRQHYPLQEAARAHDDLENRRTIGSSVLLP